MQNQRDEEPDVPYGFQPLVPEGRIDFDSDEFWEKPVYVPREAGKRLTGKPFPELTERQRAVRRASCRAQVARFRELGDLGQMPSPPEVWEARESRAQIEKRVALALLERRGVPVDTGKARAAFSLSDLWIRTKTRDLIRFSPNAVQASYLDDLFGAGEWSPECPFLSGRFRRLRELDLKARQFGISTLILGLLFLDTVNHPHTYTVVVAHDADSTERLFHIIKRFQDHLPEDRRPRTSAASRREFIWPDLDSTFFVGTAGSADFGRSATINNVHMSEVGAWTNGAEIVSGLLQAVPREGNVFAESTARGVGGWFYDEYQAASVRKDSAFTPRFWPWFAHAEYQEPVPEGWEPTAEEQVLAGQYGLTREQLVWRREKARELREMFPQEFPANAREAFLSTGGRVLAEFIPEPAEKGGHLVPDFIPPFSWRHYLLIDPGWNTTAGLCAAIDPEGCVWLYHEYYEGARVPNSGGRLPGEVMAALHALWLSLGKPPWKVLMDPSAFDLKRTRTGTPHPSDADEYREGAKRLGAEWFHPAMASNADPNAYRPKRYLAAHQVRVCQGMRWFRWEADRWIWKPGLTGRAAEEQRDPDRTIDRYNHLAGDLFRYLTNELPDPLPLPAPPVPLTAELLAREHLARVIKRGRRKQQGHGGLGREV